MRSSLTLNSRVRAFDSCLVAAAGRASLLIMLRLFSLRFPFGCSNSHAKGSTFGPFLLTLLVLVVALKIFRPSTEHFSYLHRKLLNLFVELKRIVEGFHGIFNFPQGEGLEVNELSIV